MSPIARAYPEVGAGGFTRLDGTIEFYGRINALVKPHFRVLDLGAGRGAWLDQPDGFCRRLRMLKGKVAEVVGIDVDPAVLGNTSLDAACVNGPGQPLPFSDKSFDLVVADYVFEHIEQPAWAASEIRRVLKHGGWLCARTPNRWGYISIATALLANARHASVLRWAQPERRDIDVFPTVFRLNTKRQLRKHFPPGEFQHFTYFYQAEPSYYFNSVVVLWLMRLADWLMPPPLRSNLFVFLMRV